MPKKMGCLNDSSSARKSDTFIRACQDVIAAILQVANAHERRAAMMTKEQEQVFEHAVLCGLVNNRKAAYEAGAAALRRQLQD